MDEYPAMWSNGPPSPIAAAKSCWHDDEAAKHVVDYVSPRSNPHMWKEEKKLKAPKLGKKSIRHHWNYSGGVMFYHMPQILR